MTMRVVLALVCFLIVPFAAHAGDADYDKRHDLSVTMHKFHPAREQVEAAIEQAAQSQEPGEQEAFRTAMRNVLNYEAIEKISIDAMADIYSAAELQAMVDYYSKPEAKTASKKDPEYANRVYPEIVKMLDQAMMRVRTGGQ